jgi:S-adenosylmethionine hydrolase
VPRLEERVGPNAHTSPSQPIVLTTDFGLEDPYVGVMKGVALGINPGARVIDLTHQIRPQNVGQAAFVLGTSYRFFPPGAIHVVVVDPGVGTARIALLLVTPHGRFLAPDNGVLSYVLRDYLDAPPERAGKVEVPKSLTAYSLTNSGYWLHPVSQTFHGRDIFAPVAAHLSLGVCPEALGEPVGHLYWLPSPHLIRRDNSIHGEVINVDHFGNLVTNIPAVMLVETPVIDLNIRGRVIKGLSQTYYGNEQSPEGGLVALLGSQGYLEVAVRSGSAALFLGVDVGEPVNVTLPPSGS